LIITLVVILLYVVLFAIALFCAVYYPIRMISLFMSDHYGAPFVPLEPDIVDRMVSLAHLQAGQKVYDLGSGDGRILFRAVREADVTACGYEIAIYPYILCRLRLWQRRSKHERISVERRNFFKQDLASADVIFLYQLPKVLLGLRDKFLSELRPGTIVISARFAFDDWVPGSIDRSLKHPIYVYHVPQRG